MFRVFQYCCYIGIVILLIPFVGFYSFDLFLYIYRLLQYFIECLIYKRNQNKRLGKEETPMPLEKTSSENPHPFRELLIKKSETNQQQQQRSSSNQDKNSSKDGVGNSLHFNSVMLSKLRANLTRFISERLVDLGLDSSIDHYGIEKHSKREEIREVSTGRLVEPYEMKSVSAG